ncbi:MAG: hypothetical protein JXR37_15790 [Kiritimatiellae bacterium]|nr:hypothetical protein [Kiritimatiellia bacterium]
MFLLFVLFVAVVVAVAILNAIAAKKRREAMAVLAQRLGLRFSAAKNHGLAERFRFLNRLAQGSNRYAFNVISGVYEGHEVAAFDYHYETYTRDSKGHRRTQHHRFSFFILALPARFPELIVAREGIFSKIAQAFGYDDIDFESHEFSRRFCVRSRDKKFAYDVCNARMIEYLLANTDLTIEIEYDALGIGFEARLKPEQIEPNLRRLAAVRERMPDYLFERS